MIEFENVTRRYGSKVAVDNLNLKIEDGELFTLLGPNGAGKTTTVKMLVGLLKPTAGEIRVGGLDVLTKSREANGLMGYVPDEPHLYDKLTGREFLAFISNMFGLDPDRGRARIEREIRRFGLESFVNKLTESYSHGMKQRTVFAAAMLHDPQVLIVDEPMVGLDPHSVRLVKDLLKAVTAQGTTVFMSTHTLAVAEEIADRIGIFYAGKLAFVGTLQELRQQMSKEHDSLEPLYLELIGSISHQQSSESPVECTTE